MSLHFPFEPLTHKAYFCLGLEPRIAHCFQNKHDISGQGKDTKRVEKTIVVVYFRTHQGSDTSVNLLLPTALVGKRIPARRVPL